MPKQTAHLQTPAVRRKRIAGIRAALKRKQEAKAAALAGPTPRQLKDVHWVVDELRPHQLFDRLLTLLEAVWQSGR